jgi:hypothetical protein
MLRRKKIGQSTAEYAIVIGLVIAAAVAMQVYVKRGIQAKVKDAVDYKTADMTAAGITGTPFEPTYSSSNMTSSRTSSVDTETKNYGEVVRTISADGEVSQRWGTQNTSGL